MSSLHKAYMAAIFQTLIIGLSFLFVKISLTITTPLDLLTYRFSTAFFIAVFIALVKRINLNIRKKDILTILPLAVFYPILFFLFQTFGLLYISSSEARIISALFPIFTLLLAALFLKEHATWQQKLYMLLSVSGVVFIFIMQGVRLEDYNFLGAALLLLSTLSMAFYSIIARRLTAQYPVFTLTFLMTAMGFVAFSAVSLPINLINGTLPQFILTAFHPTLILTMLYLGGLSSLLSSQLTNYTLSKLEASRMSIFGNLATVITILAGVFFLQEPFYWYHILGTVVIIAGVLGMNLVGANSSDHNTTKGSV